MSDKMTRDDLLTLMRAWGWRMKSEWPGRYQVWENPGGGTAIVPSDPEKADYDELMERARDTLAAAEAPRLLAVVREVARVAVPVGVTPSDDSWWKGHEEAMRRVRVQLAPLTETTEETADG